MPAKKSSKIISIGLCPCWDTACEVEGIDWGGHEKVVSRGDVPAGKALNISKALGWAGRESVAAGLWGKQDYRLMKEALKDLGGLIDIKMTAVDGRTRQNISILDTVNERGMHLRSSSELASVKSLRKLKQDLTGLIGRDNVCVFAGSMPGDELWGQVLDIINSCREAGAKIVVDSSGGVFRQIVDSQKLWLIKPNVEELSELLGKDIPDRSDALAKTGRQLLDKVKMVLISRGRKGAVLVTSKGCWQGAVTVGKNKKAISTVGCGDYLLAGFLSGVTESLSMREALKTAIKVATARAWGFSETHTWAQAGKQIAVQVDKL